MNTFDFNSTEELLAMRNRLASLEADLAENARQETGVALSGQFCLTDEDFVMPDLEEFDTDSSVSDDIPLIEEDPKVRGKLLKEQECFCFVHKDTPILSLLSMQRCVRKVERKVQKVDKVIKQRLYVDDDEPCDFQLFDLNQEIGRSL